jgi:hypothetical protein
MPVIVSRHAIFQFVFKNLPKKGCNNYCGTQDSSSKRPTCVVAFGLSGPTALSKKSSASYHTDAFHIV